MRIVAKHCLSAVAAAAAAKIQDEDDDDGYEDSPFIVSVEKERIRQEEGEDHNALLLLCGCSFVAHVLVDDRYQQTTTRLTCKSSRKMMSDDGSTTDAKERNETRRPTSDEDFAEQRTTINQYTVDRNHEGVNIAAAGYNGCYLVMMMMTGGLNQCAY